jgi:integrase
LSSFSLRSISQRADFPQHGEAFREDALHERQHYNIMNIALRALGYDTKEQITGYGFRATARTLIHELLGCDREVIERHLAHGSDEELGGAYDRATFCVGR